MNTSIIRTASLAIALLSPLALAVACSQSGSAGTSQIVSHSESDKKGWFGGQYHEANTVYKNSDGSTSIENETTSTKNGTTTIVREKKTTDVDGKVSTARETRTIVAGSDKVVKESTSNN